MSARKSFLAPSLAGLTALALVVTYAGNAPAATPADSGKEFYKVADVSLNSLVQSGGSSYYGIDVAASPDDDSVYVVDPYAEPAGLHTVSTSTNTVVNTLFTGDGQDYPGGLRVGVSQDDTVYITNYSLDTMSVVKGSTGGLVDTIPTGPGPSGVVVDDDSVYVSISDGAAKASFDKIQVVDAVTHEVSDFRINVHGLIAPWTLSTKTMAVSNEDLYALTYYQQSEAGSANGIWRFSRSGGESTFYPLARGPRAIALSPDGDTAYVCLGGAVDENLLVVNTVTDDSVVAPIDGTCDSIAVSPDGGTVYVSTSDSVDAYDTSNARLVGTVPVGWFPSGLAVSSDGTRVYTGVTQPQKLAMMSWRDPVSLAISGSATVTGADVSPAGSLVTVRPVNSSGWLDSGVTWSAVVDGNGNFRVSVPFDSLQPWMTAFRVEAAPPNGQGATLAAGRAVIPRNGTNSISGVSLTIRPFDVKLQVVDGANPVSNASVDVSTSSTGNGDWQPSSLGQTDNAGIFTWARSSTDGNRGFARFQVQVFTDQGVYSIQRVVNLASSPQTITLDRPVANVSGTVLDDTPGGSPVGGAWINVLRVTQQGGWSTVASGQSDPNSGAFAFSIDTTGWGGDGLRLQIDAPPGRNDVVGTTVNINPGALPWSGDVVLPAPNLAGRVVDASGTPMAQASVQIQGLNAQGNWFAQLGNVQTDQSGNFYALIERQGSAKVRFIASPSGGSTATQVSTTTDIDWGALPLTGQPADLLLRILGPNLSGQVIDDTGNPVAYANVQMTALTSQGNYQGQMGNVQADASGNFYARVDRGSSPLVQFSVFPSSEGATQVRSDRVMAWGDVPQSGLQLVLRNPNLTFTVLDDTPGGSPVPSASFQVERLSWNGRDREMGIGWGSTDAQGRVRLYIDPSLLTVGGEARKFAVTVSPPDGPSYTDLVSTRWDFSVSDLGQAQGARALDEANFYGRLTYGGSPVQWAWINAWTDNQVSLQGGSTDANGNFRMKVPDGTTVDARRPLRISAWLGDQAVEALPELGSPRQVSLEATRLYGSDSPWPGVIPEVNLKVLVSVPDDGGPLPVGNVNVNLYRSVGGNQIWIANSNTVSGGADAGYAMFTVDDPTERYVVEATPYDWSDDAAQGYAPTRVGPIAPDVNGVISVTLQRPNTVISVVDEDDNPVRNAWIWLRPVTSTQGFSAQTDQNGQASLSLAEPTAEYEISAGPPWGEESDLSQFRGQGSLERNDNGYTYTIVLPSSNFRFVVEDPLANGPSSMPEAQVEIRDAESGWGIAWVGADSNGQGQLRLDDGAYTMVVRPSTWRGDASAYGAKSYDLEVEGGVVTVSDPRSPEPVVFDDESRRWVLTVNEATFTGVVLDPTVNPREGVWNSWVEAYRQVGDDEGWLEWVDGASTSPTGTFGLTLEPGTYFLRANPSWGSSDLAPSALCTLVVEDDGEWDRAVSTCTDEFALSVPNLRFAIVDDANPPRPVIFGWACLTNTGDWTCASTDEEGRVSFFIDGATIAELDQRDDSIVIEANPPWGSDDLARQAAEVPIVGAPGSRQPDPNFTRIQLAAPNARVGVVYQGGGPALGGWVSIFEDDNGDFGDWIGGAPVGVSGVAAFSLESTAVDYCLQVWPGWGAQDEYGLIEECGVDFSVSPQGRVDLELLAANARTTVYDATGAPNTWGWVSILSPSGREFGAPLDQRGNMAAALPDDVGEYTLTFYPGPRRVGAPTRVTVRVSGGVVSGLDDEVTLTLGNASGLVVDGAGTAIPGALVSFESEDGDVTVVSDELGGFDTQLDQGMSYTVRIIPPPGSSASGLKVRFDGDPGEVANGRSFTW